MKVSTILDERATTSGHLIAQLEKFSALEKRVPVLSPCKARRCPKRATLIAEKTVAAGRHVRQIELARADSSGMRFGGF